MSTDVDWIRFGTSSFSSTDWIGRFYPASTPASGFLRYYATVFDTVEIDASYYAIPSPRTADGWFQKTPEHFLISAKFPRSIVHGGRGARPDSDRVLKPDLTYPERDRFLEVMTRLGNRCGPLLLQFPYFSRQVFATADCFWERLDRFLEDLPSGFRYAVEIRNRSWLTESFAELCRRHAVAMVLVDHAWMPHADELARRLDPVTTDYAYVRLLGDRREIEAVTTKWNKEVLDRRERLERWADFLVRMLDRQIATLVYINNHYAGHAPATARRLRQLYQRRAKVRRSGTARRSGQDG
jgi:uncharacterized protein YecE (DUF72 family)